MTTKVGTKATVKTTVSTFDPKSKDAKYDVAVPEGFSFDEHKALKKKNFEPDALYYEHRAVQLELKAKKFREKADEAKKYGSRKTQAMAKKTLKLQEKMDELKAQLAAQGIDVESLLKAKA